MSRRVVHALAWILLPLGLVACGGDKKGPTGAEAGTDFLVEHNASRNGGRTVRWARLPVRVFLGDVGREDEVTEWTGVSGGRVTFAFVGSAAGADIVLRFDSSLPDDTCAEARIRFTLGSGEIRAPVDVGFNRAIYRRRECVGGRTVTHEIGHAIGFFGHTADGGLMDERGVSGTITEPVANMISTLYSLPPGTPVGERAQSASARPSGGIASIVIVDRITR